MNIDKRCSLQTLKFAAAAHNCEAWRRAIGEGTTCSWQRVRGLEFPTGAHQFTEQNIILAILL